MSVYSTILSHKQQSAKLLAILIDPDKEKVYLPLLPKLKQADLVFVGGSTGENVEPCIAMLREHTNAPLIIFPGNASQFSPQADALLFLTLLNARTADMLIEPHVQMAIPIHKSGIEAIPMGYILIDGGRKSSVEIVSNCTPIPQSEVDRIVSTAVAGQLLGKQLIYLEAGSGAKMSISPDIIRVVRAELQVPLIVGGGICTPNAMLQAFEAGADIVVIGNHFEQHPDEIDNFVQIKRERYGK
jgi:putative glycerol-1-phosphate prenyltransferase